MTRFVATRIQFRNGERHSVLRRLGGLPVQEATIYLSGFRTRGRAANTIHAVCTALALFYRWLDDSDIDLLSRLKQGSFITLPEIHRLASACQYRNEDLSTETQKSTAKPKVVNIKRTQLRRRAGCDSNRPVEVESQATRIRYIAGYLEFFSTYIGAALPTNLRNELNDESSQVLKAFRAHIPTVSRRAKLGARTGLSEEEQSQLLQVVHPDSKHNPWKRGFVRQRTG